MPVLPLVSYAETLPSDSSCKFWYNYPCARHECMWRSGGIDPFNLNLIIRWRWVTSLKLQAL